jgi:hypothetical protein
MIAWRRVLARIRQTEKMLRDGAMLQIKVP